MAMLERAITGGQPVRAEAAREDERVIETMPAPEIGRTAESGSPAESEPLSGVAGEAGYHYRIVTVAEAVRCVAAGEWDIPEFQRQFVWQPAQVGGLADSLWRNYPIGGLLLWNAGTGGGGSGRARLWVADGQQRLTSLCLMYGLEPPWIGRKSEAFRARLMHRFDLRFDAAAERGPAFAIARARGGGPNASRLVPVARLLALDLSQARGRVELERLAGALKAAGCCRELAAEELYARLGQVCMMGRRQLAVAVVGHGRDGVLEIFARLNSRGMRFRRLVLKMAMEQIPAALRRRRGWGQP
jgi:hypothetical protein